MYIHGKIMDIAEFKYADSSGSRFIETNWS